MNAFEFFVANYFRSISTKAGLQRTELTFSACNARQATRTSVTVITVLSDSTRKQNRIRFATRSSTRRAYT